MKRQLSENEYILETKSSLLKLYGTNRPNILTHSFSSTAEQSIILMDYSGEIEGELMRIISTCSIEKGDNGFYLYYPESTKSNEAGIKLHWYVPFDEVINYSKETQSYVYRHIHHSPQGFWGIVASDDIFGVLSGSKTIIQRVLVSEPNLINDANRFIEYWIEHKRRHNLNISWVPTFLKNVYGERGAIELLTYSEKLAK